MQETLYLGNLSAKRDWGHSKDYVEAMYLMLQQESPGDYVISTGITTIIRDFVKQAAAEIGLETGRCRRWRLPYHSSRKTGKRRHAN
jgi:GDPmannose 4,6-dehydratase